MRTGNWKQHNEQRIRVMDWEEDTIYIRMKVERESDVSYQVSVDGEHYIPAGLTTKAAPGRWVGVKSGLFAINESEDPMEVGGSVAADYFRYQKTGQ